jgi:diguanylate cyclase (GGDEF)-like protein
MFTASTYLTRSRFEAVDLWMLQCLMLVPALISLALVGRALALRKHDLTLRFELEKAQSELTELVNRDHLTGSWNRRHLERDFDRVIASHRSAGVACYFGLFDIDRFKSINDTFGHSAGDGVLRAVHDAFSHLNGDEYLARLGGDEFALLMCGADVPDRVARALASVGPVLPGGAAVTVSLGLVELKPGCEVALDRAYRLADELLYEAKHAGGNAMRCGVAAGSPG